MPPLSLVRSGYFAARQCGGDPQAVAAVRSVSWKQHCQAPYPQRVTIEGVVEARERLRELRGRLETALGADLLGLYLFGSLATGDFYPGRSDLDLFAVLASELERGTLETLERLHVEFAVDHPEWDDRVEVGYFPRAALVTLTTEPSGTIAVISPGEPFQTKPITDDWLINWHGVCSGEVVLGPPPLDLGPVVGPCELRRVVRGQAIQWSEWIESADDWPRPFQGYAIVTMCRCLYALRHGEQASKEEAARWVGEEFPHWGDLVRDGIDWHRLGTRAGIANAETLPATGAFVRFALDQSGRPV